MADDKSTAEIVDVATVAASGDDDDLAVTGGVIAWGAIGLGAALLAIEAAMLFLRRRRLS